MRKLFEVKSKDGAVLRVAYCYLLSQPPSGTVYNEDEAIKDIAMQYPGCEIKRGVGECTDEDEPFLGAEDEVVG